MSLPATRTVPLPEAMRTFGESVRKLGRRDRGLALYRMELMDYAGRLAPIAYARLYREIENEATFTSEADAAQEKIKLVVRDVLRDIAPSFSDDAQLSDYMTDLVTWKTCRYVDNRKVSESLAPPPEVPAAAEKPAKPIQWL